MLFRTINAMPHALAFLQRAIYPFIFQFIRDIFPHFKIRVFFNFHKFQFHLFFLLFLTRKKIPTNTQMLCISGASLQSSSTSNRQLPLLHLRSHTVPVNLLHTSIGFLTSVRNKFALHNTDFSICLCLLHDLWWTTVSVCCNLNHRKSIFYCPTFTALLCGQIHFNFQQ